jgi:YD repeat-containing protein
MSTGNGSAPYVDDSCLPGIVTSATGMMGTSYYQESKPDQWGNSPFAGWGISLTRNNAIAIGTLDTLSEDFGERKLTFEISYRNFITKETNKSSPTKSYYYDARNNLNRVVYPANEGQAVEYSAEYPATCLNPKTCNKPTWVQDAKGNRTNYKYHEPSGQVERVTSPADKNGKVAVVRYEYEQKSANYYQANGVKGYGTPIWLKTGERTCADSATSGEACAGGDEVITRYEYNHPNLLLTGMTVFSQKDNQTLRTCYQYDAYGNRIGATSPNANLASCN